MQSVDYDKVKVKTKDATQFNMDPKLNYHLRRELAVDVFANFRRPLKYIEEKYMMNAVYDAYRITANRYTADSLMANQGQFEDEVKIMLDSTLTRVGFYVEQFTSFIDPPESLKDIIDQKNAAVQAALKAENEVKKAEADAKIAVAKAEGAARAMRVKADAEAYYNRTISASLSDRIVQEDFLEKWDGKMPTYFYITGKGGANVMSILPTSSN
jgi:regulator of protease activity HflC (stomatin/prohibitin superfamily)